MNEGLTLNELTNMKIDTIVQRKGFTLAEIGDEQIRAFPSLSDLGRDEGMIKNTINDWRVIHLSGSEDEHEISLHFIIGYITKESGRQQQYMTSDFVGITGDIGATRNSLYKLGKKGEGEIDMHLVFHVCAVFHSWGMGAALGVPHVWY